MAARSHFSGYLNVVQPQFCSNSRSNATSLFNGCSFLWADALLRGGHAPLHHTTMRPTSTRIVFTGEIIWENWLLKWWALVPSMNSEPMKSHCVYFKYKWLKAAQSRSSYRIAADYRSRRMECILCDSFCEIIQCLLHCLNGTWIRLYLLGQTLSLRDIVHRYWMQEGMNITFIWIYVYAA